MKVFGHDDVSDDRETIATPHLFQNLQEQVAMRCRAQEGLAMVAAGCNKMEVAGAVISCGMRGHEHSLDCDLYAGCDE